jgi:hypothetical protein
MKVIAVYLTDAEATEPPVAAFPAPLTAETRSRISEFLARVHPDRPFELREEDVELIEPSKLH